MPRVYNEPTFQYNTDVTYLGFIYRTSRDFIYNQNTTYNEAVRYIGDAGIGGSSASFRRDILRSGSNAGIGDDIVVVQRIVVRDADGAGTASESSVEAEIIYVTAQSEDIVNGTSEALVSKDALRSSTDAGVGSYVSVRLLIARRSATDSASGYMNTAIGVNAGKTLNAKIRMSPYWSNRKPRHIRIR